MKAYTPGGRFDTDFETKDIHAAISSDLQNPVGTHALWYVWDANNSGVDPIYDVGKSDGTGRRWRDPVTVPIIRAVVSQGSAMVIGRGFYNADRMHLTIDHDVLMSLIPDILDDPDPLNRDRIVWKSEVYRPYNVQQQGIIAEKYTLLTFDCQQVMPEELVNDAQFQAYAS
jgi:hypothetical protein